MTEKETMDAHPIGDAMKTTKMQEAFNAWWKESGGGSVSDEVNARHAWQNAWDACAALTSKESVDGWVSVPVEPTRAMVEAAELDACGKMTCDDAADAYAAMLAAAPQPQNHSEDVREEVGCKGYALLGSGQYIINHSQDFDPELGAELMITLASEEEKSSRTVGDLKDNPTPGSLIYPKDMVIRIGFINERGLFALEQQLQIIREQFFPEPAANPLEDVRGLAACVTCGQPVEPVAWVDDGGLIFWKDGVVPDGTDIYTLSPTATQALRMAADVCDQQKALVYPKHSERKGTCDDIKEAILALIPPTESDQRKLGFAELQPLMDFYDVSTVEELAAEQAKHIERLQAKLPSIPDQFPPSYRRG